MPWDTSNRKSRLPRNWHSTIVPHILKRDKRQCKLRYPMCTGRATQVDHINPGDDHRESNLQAACGKCHSHKSAVEGRSAQLKRRSRRFRSPERHPGLKYDD